MTLNDLECPFCVKIFWGSGSNELAFLDFGKKTVRKLEELPIYCQEQNCSPGILVSSKVRFIWIFVGGMLERGVK